MPVLSVNQTVAFQNPVHGTDCDGIPIRMFSQQHCMQLRCAPVWPLLPQLDDGLFFLGTRSFRTMQRSPAAVRHLTGTTARIPFQPGVAGWPADAELYA